MRTIALLITALFSGMMISSCDKGDIEIKRLTHGSGIWDIESIVYETYDASGSNVVGTSALADVGELVFFESPTMNALYAHHLVVANINDTSGVIISNPGDCYFDGDRVHFDEDPDVNHNFPDFLEGTWTVVTDKRREQVWTFFETDVNGTLMVKRTITLKLQKGFD